MNSHLRPANVGDAADVSTLVHAGFSEHVAADWDLAARQHFLAETSPERLAAVIAQATFVALYHEHGELLGVIALPRPTLVQLFFVQPRRLGQGIGRTLWEGARTYLAKHHAEIKTVELNSSPYAVQAYKALGFFPISEPFRRGGAVATRMACWLPGRSLERP